MKKIEKNITELMEHYSKRTFIFDLLAAYGQPKSTIDRLSSNKGSRNISLSNEEVIWPKELYFKMVRNNDPHIEMKRLLKQGNKLRGHPRFIIVTDYETFLAEDTKRHEPLDIPISKLPKRCDFFRPWANFTKARHEDKYDINLKATNEMAELYDVIKLDNPYKSQKSEHILNVFFARLLYCYFAEDTTIFDGNGIFTNAIASYTVEDGNDLDEFFNDLFRIMNIKKDSKKRKKYPSYLQQFPYVDGGVFAEKIQAPKLSKKARKILINCGELSWKVIDPDIFGSMIQTITNPKLRHDGGLYYTSVENINKVLKPLFLDKLDEELKHAKHSLEKLQLLYQRISKIKVFDPACGSGNFLIIAYEEICELERKILVAMKSLQPNMRIHYSAIKLSNFYGIDINVFAREVAIISLCIAEHLMNIKFKESFGKARPSLPLKDLNKNIVCANAVEINWNDVCRNDTTGEIYIVGNPQYLGRAYQNKNQKADMKLILEHINGYKLLDYIAIWFIKAANYISNTRAEYAFLSTSSINQGEQVSILWPDILNRGLEISFAYLPFNWTNLATGKAGVTCVVIGVRNKSEAKKIIFDGKKSLQVNNINPYLRDDRDIYIINRQNPLSLLPKMEFGNMALDRGNLIMSKEQMKQITKGYQKTKILFKRIIGAQEFIKDKERWCLWIKDCNLNFAMQCREIRNRIKLVEAFRKSSSDKGTRKLSRKSYQFREMKNCIKNSIIIPRVTSEKREYLPIGLLGPNDIVLETNQAIYDPELYIFGILSSKLHMLWVKTVAGRFGTSIRYSSTLCYNNFPVPPLTDLQKQVISQYVFNIIGEREKYPEKTIAQLYDPKTMPKGLRQAHKDLDKTIEKCYREKPFESDQERLSYLFQLYEKMLFEEKQGEKHA